MLFLPLWLLIDNFFLSLFFLSTIFFRNRNISFKNIIFFSLFIFFIYNVIIGLFSNQLSKEVQNFIKILPLILIPISMLTLNKDSTLRGLFYLLIGILIMQLISIYGIIDYYYFSEGKKMALRNYAKINTILRFERPYVGYFSALSLIISYILFKYKSRWVFLTTAILSILLILIISARLAIITVLFSFVLLIIYEINKRTIKIIFLLGLMLLGFGVLKFSDTPIKHRFSQIKYDARLIIWEGASNIFEENSKYIFGLGGQQQIKEDLLKYYKNKAEFEYPPDKDRFVKLNYNTHNQYINELLRGGVTGLFLFILPFGFLVYKSLKLKLLAPILLLMSVVIFSFVENVLDRQIGVYIVAIILSISNNLINEEK